MVIIGMLAMIFLPLIGVVFGYFAGWLMRSVFPFAGNWIVNGAGALGLKLALSDLPSVGALLGFFVGFLPRHSKSK